MPPGDEAIRHHRYRNHAWEALDARVITESTVSLTVNGVVWLSFMCTPIQLEALALGFLFNEGIIQSPAEVDHVRPCDNGQNVDVWLHKDVQKPTDWRRTSGCTGGVTSVRENGDAASAPIAARSPIPPETILGSMDQLFRAQELYRQTRGIHCSALSDGETLHRRAEDIGRHNTLDKIAGMLLMEPLSVSPRLILTTGRISSEMLQKSARLGAEVVVSRTAASSMAIDLAQRNGITLIGYARRNEFYVYAHPERLTAPETALLQPGAD